ncbi:MAG: LIC12162 family protein, partial [Acidimicrobiales bacterium]|nr:LIC12162 family protein [Acidimicrobiales bacterium]
RRVEQPVQAAVESDQRGWSLGEADPGSFDFCIRKMVPWLLPSAYLEGYGSLGAQINRLRWPERPSVVFTSASHFYDDVFKAWCAEKVEAGAPLVIGQHGGHVGIGWSFVHDHQMEVADRFLSWGWEVATEPKVVPVGMLKAPVLPDRHLDGDGRVVLILGNETAQLTSLTSSALSSQFNDYLEELHTFVEELAEEVRGELTVRLSRHDIDWEVGGRWRSRHPEVVLDDGHRPVLDLLSETRLFIATNNGTTFLESIYLDVPTVMFWDTEKWGLTSLALPAFAELRAAGVFFDDPISAARHVSEIWGDVGSWWANPAVREAIASFSLQFCRQSPDVVDGILSELASVAGGR